MEGVSIRDFKVRYRLPSSRLAERERLDRLLTAMLDEHLEPALARVGVDPEEEICIRSLHVPWRVRVTATDASIASGWALAIADAVKATASQPRNQGVVRYRSTTHALMDLAASVALGDFDRVWAWRQLGLWTGGEQPSRREAVEQLVQALLREAKLIVPVLRILANPRARSTAPGSPSGLPIHDAPEESSPWARLAPKLEADDWRDLADAALVASGAATRPAGEVRPERAARLRAEVSRVLEESHLGRVAPSALTGPRSSGEILLSLAALMVLEVSPAGVTTGGGIGAALIDETARQLGAKFLAGRNTVADGKREQASEASTDSIARNGPLTPAADGRAGSPAAPGEQAKSLDAAKAPKAEPPEPAEASSFESTRKRAWSDYGGLLFLVCLVRERELPKRIVDAEILARRSFPWVLHQLALRLAPVGEDDAAALAFAGLAPGSEPPSAGQPLPDEQEEREMDGYVAEILAALRESLGDSGRDDLALAVHVSTRPCELVADPGWIEARFSLEDVSLDIRRAGLDLDPGYLPWLGIVLRFVYG